MHQPGSPHAALHQAGQPNWKPPNSQLTENPRGFGDPTTAPPSPGLTLECPS